MTGSDETVHRTGAVGAAAVLSGTRKWTLLTTVVGWALLFGTRLIYPALATYVRVDFGVSTAVVGLLFTLLMLAYAAMQFPSGVLSDRLGEKTVLLWSLGLTTAGSLLLAGAPTFLLFGSGCVVFGLGSGLYQTPQLSILAKVFPDNRGTAHGIAFAAGGVGTVLPVVAGVIATDFDWRLSFGAVVPALVVVTVAIRARVPDPDRKDSGSGSRARTRVREQVRSSVGSLRSHDIVFAFAALLLVSFTLNGLTALLPLFLIDVKQFQSLHATAVFGLFFVSGTAFQVVAGVLGDRYGAPFLLAVTGFVSGLALVLVALSGSVVVVTLLVVPLSLAHAFISLGMTYLIDRLPDGVQGGGLGLVRSIVLSVGSLSAVVLGYFADRGLFTESVVAYAVLLFGGGAFFAYLYRHSRGTAARLP